MPDVSFDRYYRYDDLTAILKGFADEFPDLVTLESIGKSYEGRDIWCLTITNSKTGPAAEKPALYVDGNIHASEVSPSSACLYLINTVTTAYGSDENITRALDTRAFYVIPRVNPDGAEWALADEPRIVRSSTRPYPYDEDPEPGLEKRDVDGDGRMLLMRIEDPDGAWKPHPDEPRLMIRRDPAETGGTYYRILPEGIINNYDGAIMPAQGIKQNLDMNRNFPNNWRPEGEQPGAGPYPTSEPEARALVEFIVSHPNITGGIAFHTWSGVLLRPYGTKADSEFPVPDLRAYKKIGDKGTAITGYPNISVFHDFKYDPKEVITGVFDDWLYEQRGAFGWTVEIWSPQRQAGITDYKYVEWFGDHPVEDDLKMLKWSDEKLDGKGYIGWYPFAHPQLGQVELGGWDVLYSWRNPPPHLLEDEIAPFAEWLVWHLLISPKLEQHTLTVTPLGGDNYHVQWVVKNTGWLPSYVTHKALEQKVVRGVITEVTLPEGASLRSGKPRQDIGQLEGRNTTPAFYTGWGIRSGTPDRAKAEWVIHAPDSGSIELIARHDRAGVIRETVALS
jgi:murein tripeptide amidase MpaA